MHRSLRSKEDTIAVLDPRIITKLNFGGKHALLDYYEGLANAKFRTNSVIITESEMVPKKHDF